jgi:hypothetical protein
VPYKLHCDGVADKHDVLSSVTLCMLPALKVAIPLPYRGKKDPAKLADRVGGWFRG